MTSLQWAATGILCVAGYLGWFGQWLRDAGARKAMLADRNRCWITKIEHADILHGVWVQQAELYKRVGRKFVKADSVVSDSLHN